jgi:hypothetical protein
VEGEDLCFLVEGFEQRMNARFKLLARPLSAPV